MKLNKEDEKIGRILTEEKPNMGLFQILSLKYQAST
jgi:hypothetical protein